MPHLLRVPAHVAVVRDLASRLPVMAGDCAVPPVPLGLASQQVRPDSDGSHADQQFLDMLKAYRPSGGLLRSPNAAARCKPRGGTDVPTLAGWIVRRQVVSFEWLSRIWLPVFQFQRSDMRRHSGLDEVLSELVEVYDNWQIASWFALPNPWLEDALPADRLATAAADVLAAARAERLLPTVQPLVCY